MLPIESSTANDFRSSGTFPLDGLLGAYTYGFFAILLLRLSSASFDLVAVLQSQFYRNWPRVSRMTSITVESPLWQPRFGAGTLPEYE